MTSNVTPGRGNCNYPIVHTSLPVVDLQRLHLEPFPKLVPLYVTACYLEKSASFILVIFMFSLFVEHRLVTDRQTDRHMATAYTVLA